MAWHIPQELMNNNPLEESEVRKRFETKGFQILEYNYKNNETRMTCLDNLGYKVKVSLSSLSKNVKQYTRFSLYCNAENFLYNAEVYRKLYDIPAKVIDVRKSLTIPKHTDVLCKCECGELFWTDFGMWRSGRKVQCNRCTKHQSYLEYITEQYLIEQGIEYITQYRFDGCKDKKPLPFDFYLPKYNLCIEVDGEGHYSPRFHQTHTSDREKQNEYFQTTKRHDMMKTQYCHDNGIGLLRLKYTLYRNGSKILDKYKEVINQQLTLG